jgi:O-antigen/teichoic acid export membrane protein
LSDDRTRVLFNTAYGTIGDVGSKLASVALYVVMARKLGEAGFGVFIFALTLATLLAALAEFGQDVVIVREVARDRSRAQRYLVNTIALKLIVALPILAVGVGAALVIGSNRTTLEAVVLLGLAVIVDQFTSACFGVLQAFERFGFIPVSLISQRAFTAAAGIGVLLAGGRVVPVAAIYLAGSLLGFGLTLGFLVRRIMPLRFSFDPSLWWPLMRAAVPIGLGSLFATLLARVDTAMLAAYKSKAVVGNYGAAYRMLETTYFVAWSVGGAVYPLLSRLTPTSEPRLGVVVERALKLVTALTLPLAAGSAILGNELVHLLYGSNFKSAGPALQLLAPAIALYPVVYVLSVFLVARDRQVTVTVLLAVVALENILLNLVLIPWLSLKGAAIGTSISAALAAGALVVFGLRRTGRLHLRRMLAGPVLATGLAAAAMLLARSSLPAALVAGVVVYITALALFEHLAFPDDARAIRALIRRRSSAEVAG